MGGASGVACSACATKDVDARPPGGGAAEEAERPAAEDGPRRQGAGRIGRSSMRRRRISIPLNPSPPWT